MRGWVFRSNQIYKVNGSESIFALNTEQQTES